MTQCYEEIQQLIGTRNPWQDAKDVIGAERLTLGPQASQQWLHAPEHLAMVLARYRAAAALIGTAQSVLEIGCGEGIGAGILQRGRKRYRGIDSDVDAIQVAREVVEYGNFMAADACQEHSLDYDAVVSLDVIEHIPAEQEAAFMQAATTALTVYGVCVIGTPNEAFKHLASPQSKAGHINLYTHARLHALMARHFRVVQSFGLQDTSLHLGHPDARHYLLMVGIGPW